MTDIVERLRGPQSSWDVGIVCNEAAAEIERLRAALELIDAIGNGIDKDAPGETAYVSLMRCGKLARKALAKVPPC